MLSDAVRDASLDSICSVLDDYKSLVLFFPNCHKQNGYLLLRLHPRTLIKREVGPPSVSLLSCTRLISICFSSVFSRMYTLSQLLQPRSSRWSPPTLAASSSSSRFLSEAASARTLSGADESKVDIGSSRNYVILNKTGTSPPTVPTSAITGDIAVSPIAATAVTGFDLSADSTNTFSTSSQITGKVFAANYAAPIISQAF